MRPRRGRFELAETSRRARPLTSAPDNVPSTPIPAKDNAITLIPEVVAQGEHSCHGEGVTYRDSGTVTYVPSQEYETPLGMHGVHDRFSGADLGALICDGLT